MLLQMALFHFLWLSTIPLYMCVYIHIYTYIYIYRCKYILIDRQIDVKTDTIKLLEENISRILFDMNQSNNLWICLLEYGSKRYNIFFIHSSVDAHLGCFCVLAIINAAAVNIGVHVFFRIMVFSGYMPRSRIAGLYANFIFSFLRNLHTVLHSDCTAVQFHQQYRQVLLSPYLFLCLFVHL